MQGEFMSVDQWLRTETKDDDKQPEKRDIRPSDPESWDEYINSLGLDNDLEY